MKVFKSTMAEFALVPLPTMLDSAASSVIWNFDEKNLTNAGIRYSQLKRIEKAVIEIVATIHAVTALFFVLLNM